LLHRRLFMPNLILTPDYFERPAAAVAPQLLGKYLVLLQGTQRTARMITEVEAYVSERDRACHAYRGKTPRNAPLFGPPGHWYVYFIYGMYWMLNIVTGKNGAPAAVLIRGLEGLVGPGRLTKALHIDKAFNGRPADESTNLWIEDRGVLVRRSLVRKGPRVGVDYAGPYWAKRHLRFWLEPERLHEIRAVDPQILNEGTVPSYF